MDERCPDCNGLGETFCTTDEGVQRSVLCLNCRGAGWLRDEDESLDDDWMVREDWRHEETLDTLF